MNFFLESAKFSYLCYPILNSHTGMEFNVIKILDLSTNCNYPREGSLHFIFLNLFLKNFLKAFFAKNRHIILVLIQTILTH
jgi:hypothetical protein